MRFSGPDSSSFVGLARPRSSRNERFDALKRRLARVSRLLDQGKPLEIERAGQHVIVNATRLKSGLTSARALVDQLRKRGLLTRGALEQHLVLESPLLPLDRHAIAEVSHDLRILASQPILDLAAENQRLLMRYGIINLAWIKSHEERLQAFSFLPSGGTWEENVVRLIGVLRGDEEAERAAAVIGTSASCAQLALLFPIGERDVPKAVDEAATPTIAELASTKGVCLAEAIALAPLKINRTERATIAWFVAQGLDLDLVLGLSKDQLIDLAKVPDVRAAKAYATWTGRLAAHYKANGGVEFSLPPGLFNNLPKNEDLGILAACLVDQQETTGDPIAVLDATLSLFKKLPHKAKTIVGNLRDTKRGEGRRVFPEFSEWLNDENGHLLDRLLHLASLAETNPLSASIREDFERAERHQNERAHLESLSQRSTPQEGRLQLLRRATLDASPLRTKRRIQERIDALLPVAYRHELDATFREIVHDAWGIMVPTLDVAWRDAVRFFLITEDNRRTLRTLLRKRRNPDYDVKRDSSRNQAWIAKVEERIDIAEWLRPRRREIEIEGERFVIEMEMDPLEVLRMGIPFGTCLSLIDGVNAASCVYNALEANKRVLYVRNEKRNIIARKLLAISENEKLLGYQLYISLEDGERKNKVRAAVLEFCREISHSVHAPFASKGEPEKLHNGFWYDDGTVPFEEGCGLGVAEYCEQELGLPAPRSELPAWLGLEDEAKIATAMKEENVEVVRQHARGYDNNPFARVVDTWLCERLSIRALERTDPRDRGLFYGPMARHFSAKEGENGLVKALELAVRTGERYVNERVPYVIASFPPSPKIAAAVAEMGRRSIKKTRRLTDHGLEHLTLTLLPTMLTENDLVGAFDVLDTVDSVWNELYRRLIPCRSCVNSALDRAANAVLALYESHPDADVVLTTLMSKRRTRTAKLAALRIAARHHLAGGGGDRALARLASLHADVVPTPDYTAAILRQLEADKVTSAIIKRTRAPRRAPFEDLRDLLLRVEDIDWVLGSFASCVTKQHSDIDKWQPSPWELAWRRRRLAHDPELREALFTRAMRSPRSPTLAMTRLAQLGDLEKLAVLRHADRELGVSEPAAPAGRSPHEWRQTARSLLLQITATKRGAIDPRIETEAHHVDAAYAELARARLFAPDHHAEHIRAAARQVVLHARDQNLFDGDRLLEDCITHEEVETARVYLSTSTRRLAPAHIVGLWQFEDEELRDAIAKCVRKNRFEWDASVWAAEREAKARGLSVDGLLERVALGLVQNPSSVDDAIAVCTVDQFRAVILAVLRQAHPIDAAKTYMALEDGLSASIYLRALGREVPDERAASIRAAVKKETATSERQHVLQDWMARYESSSQSSRFIPKPTTPEI